MAAAGTSGAASAVKAARKRAIGVIIGSLVGDASALPVHWQYDRSKLAAAFGDKEETEFFEPAQSPFYRREKGQQSGYGDLNAFMLKFLASNQGKWDKQKYAAGLQLSFGPGSEYDIHGQLEGSVDSKLWPIQGPWIQAAVRNFLQNTSRGIALENAADSFDDQADAYAKIIPLAAARGYAAVVAGMAEDPGNLQRFKTTALREILDAISVYQQADIALGGGLIAARIVFDIVATGATPIHAIERAIAELDSEGEKPNPHPKPGQERDAVATPFGAKWSPALKEAVLQWAKQDKKPYDDIVGHFGQSCSLYHSLQTPLAAVYLHAAAGKTGQELYKAALRDIHRGGGCSGSRCNLAGAIVGGQGLGAVPESWQSRTLRLADYQRQATAVLQATEKVYANRRIETWSVEMMDGKGSSSGAS